MTVRMMAAFAAFTMLLAAESAKAASFDAEMQPDGRVTIQMSGRIDIGDSDKLADLFRTVRNQRLRVAEVSLNSRGGLLPEAMASAEIIRREGVATSVRDTCASACFVLFAAGKARNLASGARLGVHMAQALNGPSEEWTSVLAARYRKYGVPASVVAKMETTFPSGMAWLTPEEMWAMGHPQKI
jgi:hypothetical protein